MPWCERRWLDWRVIRNCSLLCAIWWPLEARLELGDWRFMIAWCHINTVVALNYRFSSASHLFFFLLRHVFFECCWCRYSGNLSEPEDTISALNDADVFGYVQAADSLLRHAFPTIHISRTSYSSIMNKLVLLLTLTAGFSLVALITGTGTDGINRNPHRIDMLMDLNSHFQCWMFVYCHESNDETF